MLLSLIIGVECFPVSLDVYIQNCWNSTGSLLTRQTLHYIHAEHILQNF